MQKDSNFYMIKLVIRLDVQQDIYAIWPDKHLKIQMVRISLNLNVKSVIRKEKVKMVFIKTVFMSAHNVNIMGMKNAWIKTRLFITKNLILKLNLKNLWICIPIGNFSACLNMKNTILLIDVRECIRKKRFYITLWIN